MSCHHLFTHALWKQCPQGNLASHPLANISSWQMEHASPCWHSPFLVSRSLSTNLVLLCNSQQDFNMTRWSAESLLEITISTNLPLRNCSSMSSNLEKPFTSRTTWPTSTWNAEFSFQVPTGLSSCTSTMINPSMLRCPPKSKPNPSDSLERWSCTWCVGSVGPIWFLSFRHTLWILLCAPCAR